MDFAPKEIATPIRVPSTANLMVDSADRTILLDLSSNRLDSAWNFQITKQKSILNGFFTRIGTTEVVLEWCEENISTKLANTTISFDISGIAPNTYSGTQTISVLSGFYTVAECLDEIVDRLNDLSGTTGTTWAMVQYQAGYFLEATGAFYTVGNERLAQQLDMSDAVSISLSATETGFIPECADLRPYRYIDFVSPALTYAQDVKDSSTAPSDRDVLCRWYFSYDEQAPLDAYGFPILMGYTRFCIRRIFNPPKQIKWESNLPVGNLNFEVYNDLGKILAQSSPKSNWLMTLQVSEV